ncbi:hypothetical protein HRbin41_00728 [bacterium HR41]|nr:hypothetical protein HRbin41_00728 [bacterium HR41]
MACAELVRQPFARFGQLVAIVGSGALDLVVFGLLEIGRNDYDERGDVVPPSGAVQPADSLTEGGGGSENRHHRGDVEVDAHFQRLGRDQVRDSLVAARGQQTGVLLPQPVDICGPHLAANDDHLAIALFFQQRSDLESVVHGVHEHRYGQRLVAGLGVVPVVAGGTLLGEPLQQAGSLVCRLACDSLGDLVSLR